MTLVDERLLDFVQQNQLKILGRKNLSREEVKMHVRYVTCKASAAEAFVPLAQQRAKRSRGAPHTAHSSRPSAKNMRRGAWCGSSRMGKAATTGTAGDTRPAAVPSVN